MSPVSPDIAPAEPSTGRASGQSLILVHDYLIQMGGAERLVGSLHRAWPEAPLYVSATDYDHLLPDFNDATIHNTWMQHLPGLRQHHKKLFPVYPTAFRSLGSLDAAAAMVSSSGFAKWACFTPRTRVFCYCHTPPRFFWQTDSYLRDEVHSPVLKALAKLFILRLRPGDIASARKVHHFIANSNTVRQRIRDTYGRDSVVIYPPVETHRYHVSPRHEGYYLILSRLASYKGIHFAIAAFKESGRRLVIAGGGSDLGRLQGLAAGATNIEFRGRVSEEEGVRLMENCRAFVLPGLEDFGITPLEAHAAGKPVLAYGAGGALETVVPGRTGMLFTSRTPECINEALRQMEAITWDPDFIREHAEKFSEDRFITAMQDYVQQRLLEEAPDLKSS